MHALPSHPRHPVLFGLLVLLVALPPVEHLSR